MSDVRRFRRERSLAAVQPELREVVVHVGDGSRLGLLALDRARPVLILSATSSFVKNSLVTSFGRSSGT